MRKSADRARESDNLLSVAIHQRDVAKEAAEDHGGHEGAFVEHTIARQPDMGGGQLTVHPHRLAPHAREGLSV